MPRTRAERWICAATVGKGPFARLNDTSQIASNVAVRATSDPPAASASRSRVPRARARSRPPMSHPARSPRPAGIVGRARGDRREERADDQAEQQAAVGEQLEDRSATVAEQRRDEKEEQEHDVDGRHAASIAPERAAGCSPIGERRRSRAR